jgi:hypothetical protein
MPGLSAVQEGFGKNSQPKIRASLRIQGSVNLGETVAGSRESSRGGRSRPEKVRIFLKELGQGIVPAMSRKSGCWFAMSAEVGSDSQPGRRRGITFLQNSLFRALFQLECPMRDRLATTRTRRVRRLQAEQLELRLALATFEVVNVLDSGPGSLRQALLDAQGMPGDDAIHFSISGSGPHRIEPLSPLPTISGAGAVFLDASTQSGFEAAGFHPIELSGDRLDRDLYPTSHGLRIDGTTGSIIRGFTIHGFTNSITIHAAQGFFIEQNYLGLDPTGSYSPIDWVYQTVQENGVKMYGSTGTIGGTSAESKNVISGHGSGILIQDSQDNVVSGNFIGTDITGSIALPDAVGIG